MKRKIKKIYSLDETVEEIKKLNLKNCFVKIKLNNKGDVANTSIEQFLERKKEDWAPLLRIYFFFLFLDKKF